MNIITLQVKTVLKIIVAIAFCIAVLFIPAGTLAWPEAWVLIILYFAFVISFIRWIKKRDPELYKERTTRKKDGKLWDKILLSFYSLFLLLMLVTSGLDAVRFQWSRIPFGVKLIGFIGSILTTWLFFLVYKENTFASKVVRVQKDRKQHVIKSGPYRAVRHPMYVAIIILMLCVPLALGSFLALIFSGLIIIVFIIRTYLEDTTLQRELPGYAEYVKETRFRLIPGIW